MESQTIPVASVIFRDDLYPRIQHNPATVEQYALDLSVLPPIEINQRHELIDGWHRWAAHKAKDAETIPVTVTETASDDELLGIAIERNAVGNDRLTTEDKQKLARDLYRAFRSTDDEGEPTQIPVALESTGERKHWLAARLKVSISTVEKWTSRIDKDRKIEFRQTIARKWLQCWTVPEMAKVGLGKIETIRDFVKDFHENRNDAIFVKDDLEGKISSVFHEADPDYTDSEWFPYNLWKKHGSRRTPSATAGTPRPSGWIGSSMGIHRAIRYRGAIRSAAAAPRPMSASTAIGATWSPTSLPLRRARTSSVSTTRPKGPIQPQAVRLEGRAAGLPRSSLLEAAGIRQRSDRPVQHGR